MLIMLLSFMESDSMRSVLWVPLLSWRYVVTVVLAAAAVIVVAVGVVVNDLIVIQLDS